MEEKGEELSTPTFESFEEAFKSTKDGDAFYIRQHDPKDLIKRNSVDEAE